MAPYMFVCIVLYRLQPRSQGLSSYRTGERGVREGSSLIKQFVALSIVSDHVLL